MNLIPELRLTLIKLSKIEHPKEDHEKYADIYIDSFLTSIKFRYDNDEELNEAVVRRLKYLQKLVSR